MNPGCRRSTQQGTSLLELTVSMAVTAILAVVGATCLDSGGMELTAAHQEISGSLAQAFTLARARGSNVTVAFGEASGTGGNVVVPFGRRVKWGKPAHIPLPTGMDMPVVATLTGQAHAKVTVTPRHTAEASTWFLNDGQGALCVRLSDHGRLQFLRWRRDLSTWTRV